MCVCVCVCVSNKNIMINEYFCLKEKVRMYESLLTIMSLYVGVSKTLKYKKCPIHVG